MKIPITLEKGAMIPKAMREGDAAFDLRANVDIEIPMQSQVLVVQDEVRWRGV